MALIRVKTNVNSESFHQRHSELSDEIRAKNKREDRLLEIRLKYYEREKNIRLNILRKEQNQVERTRFTLGDDWNRIQSEKQRQSIPSYLQEKIQSEPLPVVQLSAPELFKTDWEPFVEALSAVPMNKPITPAKIIRPHSAS